MQLLPLTLGREGPSESGQFQGRLPFHLKGLPAGGNVTTFSKTMTQTSVVEFPIFGTLFPMIWNWAALSLMPSWEAQGLARKEKKENACGE